MNVGLGLFLYGVVWLMLDHMWERPDSWICPVTMAGFIIYYARLDSDDTTRLLLACALGCWFDGELVVNFCLVIACAIALTYAPGGFERVPDPVTFVVAPVVGPAAARAA